MSGRKFFTPSFLPIVLCCISIAIQAQTPEIDQDKRNLSDPKKDRLATLFALCEMGSSLPSDSFMRYAQEARRISAGKGDPAGRMLADFYIGKCYVFEGKADSGLLLSEADMQEVIDTGRSYKIYDRLWGLKITCLSKLRKFDETFAESYKLLESGEKYNDLSAQVYASNAIGSAYFNFSSDFTNTKKWWFRAYKLAEGGGLLNEFSQVLNNLSYLYYGVDNNIDSAQFFLDKDFAVAAQTRSLKELADCYSTQADIYNLQHRSKDAEEMLQKGVALYRQIGNTESTIESLSSLVDFYSDRKDYAKAINYARQTEELLNRSHSGRLTEFYRSFAGSYEKMGNYAMADSMLHKFIHIQDSLYAKGRVEDLARLEAKYELSNKEAFIARQKLELLRKDIWIGSATLSVLLMTACAWFLFRRYKRRQVIALALAEEKERKRIAADLHDNIGAYASAISAGIDEIESREIISDRASLQNLRSNATEIITSLRDTIWAFNKESVSLTGISDRLKTYMQKIQPAYPHIDISLEEDIAREKKLTPVQALHVFRIVQEALQNALQHSMADRVKIRIGSNDEGIDLRVEDNGHGFDPGSVHHAGNGLQNMKRRAAEADLEFSLVTQGSGGTKVQLRARFI